MHRMNKLIAKRSFTKSSLKEIKSRNSNRNWRFCLHMAKIYTNFVHFKNFQSKQVEGPRATSSKERQVALCFYVLFCCRLSSFWSDWEPSDVPDEVESQQCCINNIDAWSKRLLPWRLSSTFSELSASVELSLNTSQLPNYRLCPNRILSCNKNCKFCNIFINQIEWSPILMPS